MKTQKLIKTYFEPFKRDQKKVFSEKKKFKDDARKTWSAMKEILRKHTTKFSNHPTKITVNKTDIFDVKKIADEFNKFFIKIGTDLANKISNASNLFHSYAQGYSQGNSTLTKNKALAKNIKVEIWVTIA